MIPRKQFHVGLFGAQGAGKTKFMIEKTVKYYRESKKRILFGIPDDQEEKLDPVPEISKKDLFSFSGIKKMIFTYSIINQVRDYYLPEPDEVPTHIARKRKFNGMLCLDDPGVWLPGNPTELYQLLGRRRQLNMDIISAFPGLYKKAPPKYFGYLTHLELWITADSPDELIDALPSNKQEDFRRLYNHVQNRTESDEYYHLGMILKKIHPHEQCPAFDPGGVLYRPKVKIYTAG